MIAITGAAGFIGSNLAHRLAGMGHHLLLVDHPFSAAKAANWAGLSRFCFVTDALFMDALRSGNLPIEAVFHLGACSRTTEIDGNYLLWNNVKFSQAIWTWCAGTGCPFYYASTDRCAKRVRTGCVNPVLIMHDHGCRYPWGEPCTCLPGPEISVAGEDACCN